MYDCLRGVQRVNVHKYNYILLNEMSNESQLEYTRKFLMQTHSKLVFHYHFLLTQGSNGLV